jgi:hypothetical protein
LTCSSDVVADVAEDDAPQGPHQEAGGEHAEGGDQGRSGAVTPPRQEAVPATLRWRQWMRNHGVPMPLLRLQDEEIQGLILPLVPKQA